MGGGEGLVGQVCYPVTELVVTRRDKAALFSVKGVTDRELSLTPVTVLGKVRGLQSIPQKEGIAPFLGPQLCPIDCGRQHRKPGPGLCCSSQAMCVQYRSSSIVAVRASSIRICPRLRTAVQPSQRHAEWSAFQNSTWPLSDATKCTVITQDAVQFSGAV